MLKLLYFKVTSHRSYPKTSYCSPKPFCRYLLVKPWVTLVYCRPCTRADNGQSVCRMRMCVSLNSKLNESVSLSLCLSLRLSVCPSVCLSVRMSVRPSVRARSPFRSVTLLCIGRYSYKCTYMFPNMRRCVACKNRNSTIVGWWIISPFLT